jgi:Fe-S-cluster containining protein
MKEGFEYGFDASACYACEGNCCRGESGYIWLNKEDIIRIADAVGVTQETLIDDYLKKVGYRYSIKEILIHGSYNCVFYETGIGCSIYRVRPNQCKTYPFWNYFKKNKEELLRECPGIKLL